MYFFVCDSFSWFRDHCHIQVLETEYRRRGSLLKGKTKEEAGERCHASVRHGGIYMMRVISLVGVAKCYAFHCHT
jgi:hypothetical protein